VRLDPVGLVEQSLSSQALPAKLAEHPALRKEQVASVNVGGLISAHVVEPVIS